MAKFVLTYSGGVMPETQEARDASMGQWMAWFGQMGAAVVDGGNPFGASRTVTAGGVADGAATGTSGYTILEAADLTAATELAKGCPLIAVGGAVEVHEALDIM